MRLVVIFIMVSLVWGFVILILGDGAAVNNDDTMNEILRRVIEQNQQDNILRELNMKSEAEKAEIMRQILEFMRQMPEEPSSEDK
jgi:hypothetical protein